MKDAKPARDGIREILDAGRAPGVIVRGEDRIRRELPEKAKWPILPAVNHGRDAVALERDYEKTIAAKARRDRRRKMARGRAGRRPRIERVGSMPFHEYCALQRHLGKDAVATDGHEIWKRRGRMWGDA